MQISIKHKTSGNEVHQISSCTYPRFEIGYLSQTKIPVDGGDIKIPVDGGDIKIPVDGMAMFSGVFRVFESGGKRCS